MRPNQLVEQSCVRTRVLWSFHNTEEFVTAKTLCPNSEGNERERIKRHVLFLLGDLFIGRQGHIGHFPEYLTKPDTFDLFICYFAPQKEGISVIRNIFRQNFVNLIFFTPQDQSQKDSLASWCKFEAFFSPTFQE